MIEGPLCRGRFVLRNNRFLVTATTEAGEVLAHLPNPGRLRELLYPGVELLLVEKTGENRKTDLQVLGVLKGGERILLDTRLSNQLAEEAIQNGLIAPLRGYKVARREFPWKRARFDLLLRKAKSKCIVEVKACTLVRESVALFPDAPTVRGQRHLDTLVSVLRRGHRACVLFMVHTPGASFFSANSETDPEFSHSLSRAVAAGVEVYVYECLWRDDEIVVTRRVPVITSS